MPPTLAPRCAQRPAPPCKLPKTPPPASSIKMKCSSHCRQMTQCIGSWRTLERGRMLEKALQRSNCTTRWSTRGSCPSVSPTSHPRKSLSRWSQSQQAVYCATIANWMKMKHSKTSWQLIDRPMRKQLAFSVVTTMTMKSAPTPFLTYPLCQMQRCSQRSWWPIPMRQRRQPLLTGTSASLTTWRWCEAVWCLNLTV